MTTQRLLEMLDILHELKDWIIGFADSPWAVVALAVNSFTESIFNPIPSDPLILGIAAVRPQAVFWLALIATMASVAGAVIGWFLGRWFGRPVLLKIVSAKRSQRVEALFARYGVLVVLIAAFTPIPYKVFAITAGVLKFDVRPFIAISFVGRGARFFLLAGLIFYLDSTDSMEAVSGNFVAITSGVLGIGVLLGAVIGAIRWAVKRWR